MLVLSRKVLQKIHIGPNITITILNVKGMNVRVGIEAPKNVRVMRAEIDEVRPLEMEQENWIGESREKINSSRSCPAEETPRLPRDKRSGFSSPRDTKPSIESNRLKTIAQLLRAGKSRG